MSIEPVETFARFGSLVWTYSYAVEKSYANYLKFTKDIDEYLFKGGIEEEYDEKLYSLKREKHLFGIQTIVFSSMCFEASIYEFAAIHLGDEYVRRHLDKLMFYQNG